MKGNIQQIQSKCRALEIALDSNDYDLVKRLKQEIKELAVEL